MRDWKAWVRSHLRDLHIHPARESEIVAELAQHVEQIYQDALANRLSEAEAMRQVEAACGNWRDLARGIEGAEPLPMPERRPASLRAPLMTCATCCDSCAEIRCSRPWPSALWRSVWAATRPSSRWRMRWPCAACRIRSPAG